MIFALSRLPQVSVAHGVVPSKPTGGRAMNLYLKDQSLSRRIKAARKSNKRTTGLERERVLLKCKIIRSELRNERKAS